MAKITKEQKLYLDAMEHALKVAKEGGIEELEKEVRYRSSNPMPLNVSRKELTQVAIRQAKDELMIVATAMADTISNHLKLPPSIVLDYLRQFNKRVQEFHEDPEQYEAVQTKLDKDFGMNEVCRKFNEEDE